MTTIQSHSSKGCDQLLMHSFKKINWAMVNCKWTFNYSEQSERIKQDLESGVQCFHLKARNNLTAFGSLLQTSGISFDVRTHVYRCVFKSPLLNKWKWNKVCAYLIRSVHAVAMVACLHPKTSQNEADRFWKKNSLST